MKRFNEGQGYGFIASDDGADRFVNFSEVQTDGYQTLAERQRVEFAVTEGRKVPQASNLLPA